MPNVTRIGTLVAKVVGVIFSVAGGKDVSWPCLFHLPFNIPSIHIPRFTGW